LPVDVDTRLELLRRDLVAAPEVEPTWPEEVEAQLTEVIEERSREKDLSAAGLAPTRSMLFVGPPGVGKTLAARWLASRLRWPLLTLDLAAVMNSFLGRTGTNLRTVLDYARKAQSILFLDEFDAIAKRRDDASDVGELKRLVTVLLQEVEECPECASHSGDQPLGAARPRHLATIREGRAVSCAISRPPPRGGWSFTR